MYCEKKTSSICEYAYPDQTAHIIFNPVERLAPGEWLSLDVSPINNSDSDMCSLVRAYSV